MKRIYLYFVGIGGVSIAIISIWVYVKYVRTAGTELDTYPAERAAISEVIKSRGEVVAQNDFQLGSPLTSRVQRLYVAEGAMVRTGTALMRLDAAVYESQAVTAQAKLAQMQANLAKLVAGATAADIAGAQAKVADARVAMIDSIRDAYTTSDDAVHNQVDRFIASGRSADPYIDPLLSTDATLRDEIERKRVTVESLLLSWNAAVSQLTTGSDLNTATTQARDNLNQVKFFLDRVAFMINGTFASSGLSQTTLDSYKTGVSTARTNVVTAASGLSTAESALRTAENDLALKIEPARPEDIAAAQAQIAQTEGELATARANIANATIRAPANGTVVRFNVHVGELYTAGQSAVAFYSPNLKVISDISELTIGRIPPNAPGRVDIMLDAFPGRILTGRVAFIDPQEIDKEGDKYYRVNVLFDQMPPDVRPGMSADLDIILQTRDAALVIPEFLTYARDDQTYVQVVVDGVPVERAVTLGISDGERVEVVTGVSDGDIIAAPAD